jgi:major type 1 subunit fimbrin (pilin)
MKYLNIALSLCFLTPMGILVSGSAWASDGTISFTGAVVASTCVVTLNGGSSSGTVTLPSVPTTILAASGNTAGPTNFTLNLTGCGLVTGKTTVNAFFEAGSTVNPVTGNLINSGAATNVALQLLVASTSAQIIPGSPTQAQPTGVTLIATPGASGDLNYVVQYYATGVSTAGTVTSSVTYSLAYY